MNKIIDNIKSGNYEVVDNQGVSVTGHFTQCLEKEFADLEAKLAEKDRKNLLLYSMLYTTLEKQDTENVSSRIDQMTGETLDKQSEWFKTNRVCDKLQHYIKQVIKEKEELKQQLHDLPKKIVEEITNELSNNTSLYFEMRESTSAHCPNKEYEWFNYVRFRNYINAILKKYGGGDE